MTKYNFFDFNFAPHADESFIGNTEPYTVYDVKNINISRTPAYERTLNRLIEEDDMENPQINQEFVFVIDYPFNKVVTFTVKVYSLIDVIGVILKAYHQLYAIEEVEGFGLSQWGHWITDLVIEKIKFYKINDTYYCYPSIGS